MTDEGTFIINGAERVIVSQLVRSPVFTTTKIQIKMAVKTTVQLLSLTVVHGWNMKQMLRV